MNSWCESCARKSRCYTMEIRPKCYLPITNNAQGTPESYLAKALRYSRDSHEIAKDEPQFDKDINVRSKDCETCKHYKLACELFSEICKYKPTTQTETQNSNLTFEKDECAKEYEELGLKELKELIEADRKDEPQTKRSE